MKKIMMIVCLFMASNLFAYEITREELTSFPRCISFDGKNNYVFKWKDKALSREVYLSADIENCNNWQETLNHTETIWVKIDEDLFSKMPLELQKDLRQIAQKTNELREIDSATEYVIAKNIRSFKTSRSRELSRRYGPVFAAQVFKEVRLNKRVANR